MDSCKVFWIDLGQLQKYELDKLNGQDVNSLSSARVLAIDKTAFEVTKGKQVADQICEIYYRLGLEEMVEFDNSVSKVKFGDLRKKCVEFYPGIKTKKLVILRW